MVPVQVVAERTPGEQLLRVRGPHGIVAEGLDATSGRTVDVSAVGPTDMALDIGPRTIATATKAFQGAKTVFWNGPMGLFEKAPFASGTNGVAKALADLRTLDPDAFTIVGGGDSVAAVEEAGLASRFSHVSTGGGASLELIEGRKLPGVEALRG
jgi:phosphoglycerate kinase